MTGITRRPGHVALHADELALLHERLDFAERMLTQRRIEDARREEPTPV